MSKRRWANQGLSPTSVVLDFSEGFLSTRLYFVPEYKIICHSFSFPFFLPTNTQLWEKLHLNLLWGLSTGYKLSYGQRLPHGSDGCKDGPTDIENLGLDYHPVDTHVLTVIHDDLPYLGLSYERNIGLIRERPVF